MKPASFSTLLALLASGIAAGANDDFSQSPRPANPDVTYRAPVEKAAPRPNILFILVDDLGNGDLGVTSQNARANAGKPALQTPALDKLATSGSSMLQHYCPAPVCAPSRASLYLGVHQGHSNLRDNQFDKAIADDLTLASMLKSAGYATALIGKWGISGPGQDPPAHPAKRGYDYYFGMLGHLSGHFHYPNSRRIKDDRGELTGVHEMYRDVTLEMDKAYSTDLFTARAKDWIIQHQKIAPNQPFFLTLTYTAPHANLDVPTGPYPENPGAKGGVQWLGLDGNPKTPVINTANGTPDSFIYPQFATATWDHDRNPATPPVPWPDFAKRYATMVKRVDDAVNDLVVTLENLGIARDTLIVFTSDNGPAREAGAHGKFQYKPEFFESYGPHDGIKRDMWEGGLRVPTVVYWPAGLKGKNLASEVSQFQDWMPTFAQLAGVPVPAVTDGISLAGVMRGESDTRNPVIYSEYFSPGQTPALPGFAPNHINRKQNQMQVIRIGDFKGVRYNIKSHTDPFEIYNVVEDPKEARDLAASKPELQQLFHDEVLRRRIADTSARRPYDDAPLPPIGKPLVRGSAMRILPGDFPYLPHIPDSTPAKPYNPEQWDAAPQAIRIDGAITVPADGSYTFSLDPDSHAILKIHQATLLNTDTSPARHTASLPLKAGQHPVTLYIRTSGNAKPDPKFEWQGPGLPKSPVKFD